MYRATDCSFTKSYNFDIYQPSKSGSNCPRPLATRTLIKSGWECNGAGALSTGDSVIGITLDQCETLCRQELCAWLQFRTSDGGCARYKEGCEATARTSLSDSYRPAGYVFPECNTKSLIVKAPGSSCVEYAAN